MDNPTYTAEVELEKWWILEFFIDEKDGKLIGSTIPNDNVIWVDIYRNEERIYHKWFFLKFSKWDQFSIVLSLETIYASDEVFA